MIASLYRLGALELWQFDELNVLSADSQYFNTFLLQVVCRAIIYKLGRCDIDMLRQACKVNGYRYVSGHSGRARLYNHCLLVIVDLAMGRTNRAIWPCIVNHVSHDMYGGIGKCNISFMLYY